MKSTTQSFYEQAIGLAVARIYESLDDALELAALARAASLSPLHFHRIFRYWVGETPLELHRRLRLERAAEALVMQSPTEMPVTRVAFEAGYETHESFTRAFGAAYGTSPSKFRELARAARETGARLPPCKLAAPSGLHHRAGRPPDLRTAWFHSKPGEPLMQVDLESLAALRVAAVRHVGPYNRISEAFERLGRIAGQAGLVRPGTTQMLALYHDDPEATPPEALRSDAALTIPEEAALPAGLAEIRIPPARYARTIHVGPYSDLGDAWARFLGTWLRTSGHRVGTSPSFEIYLNDPMTTRPEDLRTELYLPIA